LFEVAPKVNDGVVVGFAPEFPPKVKPEAGFASLLVVADVELASVVVAVLLPKEKFAVLDLVELCPKVNADVFAGSEVLSVLLLLPNVNPELVVVLEASFPPNVKPLVVTLVWFKAKPD
jgi:hypothetical protein